MRSVAVAVSENALKMRMPEGAVSGNSAFMLVALMFPAMTVLPAMSMTS
jgi:hypothetical protein